MLHPRIEGVSWRRLAELVVAAEGDTKSLIFLGSSPGGLSAEHMVRVDLDYAVHHETKQAVADFNGDGKADLATFGTTAEGAQAVYIHLQ